MKRLASRTVKLMPDYQCFPLSWGEGESEMGDIDPRDLALSDELVMALSDWAAAFDSILNRDDPASSRFATPQAEQAFRKTGTDLRDRLQAELGPETRVVLNLP